MYNAVQYRALSRFVQFLAGLDLNKTGLWCENRYLFMILCLTGYRFVEETFAWCPVGAINYCFFGLGARFGGCFGEWLMIDTAVPSVSLITFRRGQIASTWATRKLHPKTRSVPKCSWELVSDADNECHCISYLFNAAACVAYTCMVVEWRNEISRFVGSERRLDKAGASDRIQYDGVPCCGLPRMSRIDVNLIILTDHRKNCFQILLPNYTTPRALEIANSYGNCYNDCFTAGLQIAGSVKDGWGERALNLSSSFDGRLRLFFSKTLSPNIRFLTGVEVEFCFREWMMRGWPSLIDSEVRLWLTSLERGSAVYQIMFRSCVRRFTCRQVRWSHPANCASWPRYIYSIGSACVARITRGDFSKWSCLMELYPWVSS